jgi:glutamyl-tRNA reductase
MAEETLKYLRSEGARDLTVVNRCPYRAAKLAQRWLGRTIPWERLPDALVAADLVISATGAERAVVTLSQFQKIERRRCQRPLFVLDLAVPRDFHAAIGRRPNVYLYSVDDLQQICRRNRRQRKKDLPAAMRIIDQETTRFIAHLGKRAIGPMIKRFRQCWHDAKERELERLFKELPRLDDRARGEICRSLDRLVNKLLHPPLEALQRESSQGTSRGLQEAAAKLFELTE